MITLSELPRARCASFRCRSAHARSHPRIRRSDARPPCATLENRSARPPESLLYLCSGQCEQLYCLVCCDPPTRKPTLCRSQRSVEWGWKCPTESHLTPTLVEEC